MKKNFPYEIIGEEIEVLSSNNKSDMNVAGKVVDETKFTLKIEQNGVIKTLLKKNIVFRLKKSGRIIDGKDISKKPEERLKG